MKKLITASLMMALGVAGAQAGGGYTNNTQYVAPATQSVTAPATTTAAATSTGVITDVPAGHWARQAVAHVVEAGLIEGFPDGTFRGNEYLTRYQAAMIFHRLLQSGAMSNMEQGGADLTLITRGMQEVSQELAAISSRLTDVERLTVEQESRIDALESAIAGLDTGVSDSDNSLLIARINALETRIAELENRDWSPAPAPVQPTQPAPVQPAPVQPVEPAPVDEVPVEPDIIDIGVVEVDTPAVTVGRGNTYFGLGGGYYPNDGKYPVLGSNDKQCVDPVKALQNSFNSLLKKETPHYTNADYVDYCATAFATVGSSDLMNVGGLGLGARANVEYMPGAGNAVGGDVNAVANFDFGLIQPYAGAGVGAVNGPTNLGNTTAERKTDIYGNLLLGTDFQLAQNIGLFAEANGKYFFSNNTEAAQRQVVDKAATNKGDGKGLGYGFRGGVKFFF